MLCGFKKIVHDLFESSPFRDYWTRLSLNSSIDRDKREDTASRGRGEPFCMLHVTDFAQIGRDLDVKSEFLNRFYGEQIIATQTILNRWPFVIFGGALL